MLLVKKKATSCQTSTVPPVGSSILSTSVLGTNTVPKRMKCIPLLSVKILPRKPSCFKSFSNYFSKRVIREHCLSTRSISPMSTGAYGQSPLLTLSISSSSLDTSRQMKTEAEEAASMCQQGTCSRHPALA